MRGILNMKTLARLSTTHTAKLTPNAMRQTRLMSGVPPPAPRHKFVIYAPDMTDDGAFQRRLSVRPAHLDKAREHISGGTIST